MRALMIACVVVVAVVFATMSSSRGDSEASDLLSTEASEPITGTAVEPTPGPREPIHEPFTPYDFGGPQAAWSYEQLSQKEKQVADRGLNEDQTAIQDAYVAATAALAAQASADRAALQLGFDESLEEAGVVP
jgi:hypothetical protein